MAGTAGRPPPVHRLCRRSIGAYVNRRDNNKTQQISRGAGLCITERKTRQRRITCWKKSIALHADLEDPERVDLQQTASVRQDSERGTGRLAQRSNSIGASGGIKSHRSPANCWAGFPRPEPERSGSSGTMAGYGPLFGHEWGCTPAPQSLANFAREAGPAAESFLDPCLET